MLRLSWPADARAGRSPFVTELTGQTDEAVLEPSTAAKSTRGLRVPTPTDDPVFDALRRWRRERAEGDGVPAYVVFHDATLVEISSRRPRTLADLRAIAGIGPAKLERYGQDVLAVLAGH